jgi:hypothetical protein
VEVAGNVFRGFGGGTMPLLGEWCLLLLYGGVCRQGLTLTLTLWWCLQTGEVSLSSWSLYALVFGVPFVSAHRHKNALLFRKDSVASGSSLVGPTSAYSDWKLPLLRAELLVGGLPTCRSKSG